MISKAFISLFDLSISWRGQGDSSINAVLPPGKPVTSKGEIGAIVEMTRVAVIVACKPGEPAR